MKRGRSIHHCRDFLESLRQWDVIRMNGKLRVIREVHIPEGKAVKRRSFTFAILHCSWTGKPYTVMTIYDLVNCKVELVLRNYRPKSSIEHRLQAVIENKKTAFAGSEITCCDIHGIT